MIYKEFKEQDYSQIEESSFKILNLLTILHDYTEQNIDYEKVFEIQLLAELMKKELTVITDKF